MSNNTYIRNGVTYHNTTYNESNPCTCTNEQQVSECANRLRCFCICETPNQAANCKKHCSPHWYPGYNTPPSHTEAVNPGDKGTGALPMPRKSGRPKLAEKKERVAIRLYKYQIDLLTARYGSAQKGINELIKQISE